MSAGGTLRAAPTHAHLRKLAPHLLEVLREARLPRDVGHARDVVDPLPRPELRHALADARDVDPVHVARLDLLLRVALGIADEPPALSLGRLAHALVFTLDRAEGHLARLAAAATTPRRFRGGCFRGGCFRVGRLARHALE